MTVVFLFVCLLYKQHMYTRTRQAPYVSQEQRQLLPLSQEQGGSILQFGTMNSRALGIYGQLSIAKRTALVVLEYANIAAESLVQNAPIAESAYYAKQLMDAYVRYKKDLQEIEKRYKQEAKASPVVAAERDRLTNNIHQLSSIIIQYTNASSAILSRIMGLFTNQ
jgi:hypothetical protein